jgi:selenide,water dikinase
MVPEKIRDLCFDPQTSGGLLFSVPEAEAGPMVTALNASGIGVAAIIGQVVKDGRGEIYVY